ncbi:hypothetical protein V8F20_006557 [Naviculisporaceae sp. PSN 640]
MTTAHRNVPPSPFAPRFILVITFPSSFSALIPVPSSAFRHSSPSGGFRSSQISIRSPLLSLPSATPSFSNNDCRRRSCIYLPGRPVGIVDDVLNESPPWVCFRERNGADGAERREMPSMIPPYRPMPFGFSPHAAPRPATHITQNISSSHDGESDIDPAALRRGGPAIYFVIQSANLSSKRGTGGEKMGASKSLGCIFLMHVLAPVLAPLAHPRQMLQFDTSHRPQRRVSIRPC